MTNNNEQSRAMSELLDDEPTDELPVAPDMPEPASKPPRQMASRNGDRTDVLRLENEIRQLQSKWSEVEESLAQRDRRIQQLEAELDGRSAAIEALNTTLRAAEERIEILIAENTDLNDSLQARELTITELRNSVEIADAALAQLRADAQARSRESGTQKTSDPSTKELQSSLADARQKIQDLEIYIDGSNRERRKLRSREKRLSLDLQALQEAATAQERELENRDREITRLRHKLEQCTDKKAILHPNTAAEQKVDTVAPPASASQDNRPETATTAAADCDLDQHEQQVTRLMVAIDQNRAVKYPLYKGQMTIGRAPDSDIQIQRQHISRHHARLLNDEHHTFIEDLGSRNGVCVNALRIQQRQRLKNGDLIDIGKSQFQFVDLMEPLSGPGNA